MTLAVLMLAPSLAEARGGHAHVTATATAAVPSDNSRHAERLADGGFQLHEPHFSVKEAPDGEKGCNGSCCAAACGSCCVSLNPQSASQGSPYTRASLLPFADDASGASAVQNRLRRPPISFA